jgi:hypothetical protein
MGLFKKLFKPKAAVDIFGIDYSFGEGLTVAQMKAAGVKFVCRYISGSSLASNPKNISKTEFNNLVHGGIDVVLVWETTADRILGGHVAGVQDALAADAATGALGAIGLPVYFAADFDATEGQQAAINAYLDGVASVIGHDRTGLYAGFYPIARAFNAGKIRYGWQTYAWSGGQLDGRAQLYQYSNGHQMGPTQVDYDKATHVDYGQWPLHVGPTPPPPPAPKPAVGLPVLHVGLTGDAVKLAQSLTKTKTPPLVVDGVFGPATLAAVQAYQKKSKLVVDGVVGPTTWAKMGNYS